MTHMIGSKLYVCSKKAHRTIIRCLWEMSDGVQPKDYYEYGPLTPKETAMLDFLLKDLGLAKDSANGLVSDRVIIALDLVAMSATWDAGYEAGLQAVSP